MADTVINTAIYKIELDISNATGDDLDKLTAKARESGFIQLNLLFFRKDYFFGVGVFLTCFLLPIP